MSNTKMPESLKQILREAAAQRGEYNSVDLLEPPGGDGERLRLSPEEILGECALEPETDIGNARRLLIRYGDRILFVARIGWHVYDGQRYKEDEDGSGVRPLAQRTAEFIDDEAILLDAQEDEKAKIAAGRVAIDDLKKLGRKDAKWTAEEIERHERLQAEVAAMQAANKARAGRMSSRHGHAKSAAGTSKLNNMLTEAAPHCAKMVKDLNLDLYAVNTRSGTLRFIRNPDGAGKWRTRLDPHNPQDLITKLAPTNFSPRSASAPLFKRFMSEVMPDTEMQAFLQRFMGYCLLGSVSEHCLLFFHGSGRNGKSTFAELFADILGDYAVSMSIDSFSGDQQRKGSDATPDLARLPGVRLITAEEPEMGVKLKGALIKKMTGGTKMEVRKLNQEFFELMPQFKIILSGNHKPVIIDDSEGMWARVHMVPWNVHIDKEKIDRNLPQKLRLEHAGIFGWMVEGALSYLESGLRPPKQVVEATEEYRQDSDPIGDFLRNCCEVSGKEEDSQTPGELYDAYQHYAKRNGLPEFHSATFTRRLPSQTEKDWKSQDGTSRRFWKIRSNGTFYRGIRVKSGFEVDGDPYPGRFPDDEPLPEHFT